MIDMIDMICDMIDAVIILHQSKSELSSITPLSRAVTDSDALVL